MNNSRNKRKSGSVAFADLNSNDLRKDVNIKNRRESSDDGEDLENQTGYVNKAYQNLVTSIMYSMFNPYVSFPEKRYDSGSDTELEADPNIPITEDYDSPVTTLKLKVASKEDAKIRRDFLDLTDRANEENSINLNNEDNNKASGLSFISVDLTLPQTSISRNIQYREKKSKERIQELIDTKKTQRKQQVKDKREEVQREKRSELQKGRIERREKYNEKEANMSNRDKRKLETVRRELHDGTSRASASIASRSIRPDDTQTSKTHEYLEVQKNQKDEFLKTRGKTKKQDNIASILMGNYK